MSHGYDIPGAPAPGIAPVPAPLAPVARLIAGLHRVMVFVGMLGLLAAAGILSAAVFLRYFLHTPTDWQDEVAVFCLVGMTFLCAGFVQQQRGHIGIEALAGLLPERVDRLRRRFVDLASFFFCAFFTWKSLTLFLEAYNEGQTTSSTWAPPLAIPYGLMLGGMVLLTLQLLLQVLAGLLERKAAP